MGGVLGDTDMSDVRFKNWRSRGVSESCEGASRACDVRDPSVSFLAKQLSTMRRFSSSNRAARLSMAVVQWC